MSTGPTGTTENTQTESTGTTENTQTESTGPTGPTGTTQTESTGPTGPQNIVTLDELLASHAAVVAIESAHRLMLDLIVKPSREQYRPVLFQWAAAGFPAIYVVRSFTLAPPSICSDGVTRDVNAYINYLTGSDMGAIVANIQSLMTGITVSFSFSANTVHIHVTKA